VAGGGWRVAGGGWWDVMSVCVSLLGVACVYLGGGGREGGERVVHPSHIEYPDNCSRLSSACPLICLPVVLLFGADDLDGLLSNLTFRFSLYSSPQSDLLQSSVTVRLHYFVFFPSGLQTAAWELGTEFLVGHPVSPCTSLCVGPAHARALRGTPVQHSIRGCSGAESK
jgi:hypothetical protein